MGISGDLYNLLESYLLDRLQRDVLNGHNLTAELVLAGVPKVQFRTHSLVKLFGNGTSLYTIVRKAGWPAILGYTGEICDTGIMLGFVTF